MTLRCSLPECNGYAAFYFKTAKYPYRCWHHQSLAPQPVELPPFEQCPHGVYPNRPGVAFRLCSLMRGHSGECR